MDIMEARNLVTARETAANGNWLVPTMNGAVRLEKPPLPTWAAAAVMILSGGTDSLALLRLPNAAAATMLVLFSYALARHLGRGRDRALALGTAASLAMNLLVMEAGRRATWDIFCHAFMLGAIWLLARVLTGEKKASWPPVAAGLLLGLSFMSKGPVAFFAMLAPFLIAYAAVFGMTPFLENKRGLGVAFLTCFLAGAAWPLAVYLIHPESLLAVTAKESGAWVNKHVKSWWFYIQQFYLYAGIFIVPASAGIAAAFRRRLVPESHAGTWRLALVWLAAGLVLLSIVPEKKARYMLPLMVPLSIVTGSLVADAWKRVCRDGRPLPAWTRLHGAMLFLFGLALAAALPCFIGATPLTLTLSLVMATLGAGGLRAIPTPSAPSRVMRQLSIHTLALAAFATLVFFHFYPRFIIANPEYRPLRAADLAAMPADTTVFQLHGGIVDLVYVWDLRHGVREWNKNEAARLLAQDKPFFVISKGPAESRLLRELGPVSLEVIGLYDYKKSRPRKDKIELTLVRPAPGNRNTP